VISGSMATTLNPAPGAESTRTSANPDILAGGGTIPAAPCTRSTRRRRSPMRVLEPLMTTTPATGSRYVALTATLFAVAMTFIDQTIVAIAAPRIQDALNLSQDGTRWAVNAYLLALAATFALGGRLADVLGPRRMVVAGVITFAGASALCGATPTG